ncbi:MAG: AlpA family transcriptional regulator [Pseudomonadota bacterium]
MNSELDPFLDRAAVREMTTLSFPTINRMQRAGRFPRFEQISAGRVGLRKSVLVQFLAGKRDWESQSIVS